MTAGGNRTRKTGKTQTFPEPEAAVAGAPMDEDRRAAIERRAYEIYLNRNGTPGDAVADWLQAEHEVRGDEPTGSGPRGRLGPRSKDA